MLEKERPVLRRSRPRSRVAETAGWVAAIGIVYLGGWLGWHLGVVEDAGRLLFGQRAGTQRTPASSGETGLEALDLTSVSPMVGDRTGNADTAAVPNVVPAPALPDLRGLLDAAAQALRAERATTPAQDNAFDRYLFVLGMDPDNEQALIGVDKIIDFYAERAKAAQMAGRLQVAASAWRQAYAVSTAVRAEVSLGRSALLWLNAEQRVIEAALAGIPGGGPLPAYRLTLREPPATGQRGPLTNAPSQDLKLEDAGLEGATPGGLTHKDAARGSTPPVGSSSGDLPSEGSPARAIQKRLDARVARLIAEANQAAAAGQVRRARELYRTVLTLGPNNEDAKNGLIALSNARVRIVIPPLLQRAPSP